MRLSTWLGAAAVSSLAMLAASACSSDEDGVAGGGGNGGSAAGGSSDASLDTSNGQECGPTKPCPSGVCVSGICCPTAESACAKSCCSGSEVCLFEQCIVPGKACQSQADCADGEYCETALGETPDAGPPDGGGTDGGAVCTQPVPANGHCVPLPPICDENGKGPDGGPCFEKCEYHPTAGQLDAVIKWQWGQQIPAKEFPGQIDVWSTPAVARVVDANCDGAVDEADPPNIVFVSSDVKQTCCHCSSDPVSNCRNGKLRVLDGRNGQELFTLSSAKPNSPGFAGVSVALGDVTGDTKTDIVAMTGDGYIVVIDASGSVVAVSDQPVDTAANTTFGWGGGIALGDMDGDGAVEIAYGRNLYELVGTTLTRQWVGTGGNGGGAYRELSFFVDLDGDGKLELLAGNTAYKADGSVLWTASAGGNGFNAVADFDGDGKPEVVLVAAGTVYVLEGATGVSELTPLALPSTGAGGPPTVADFDGDGKPEIGVAQQTLYAMIEADYTTGALTSAWQAPNHDLSSSVTGSSVFDFEGDGQAEVVYNDECFLWVYDGESGAVLFAGLTTSFTGTEASIVADVDGDGRAEIVMVSNGVDPSNAGWKCNIAPWNQPDPAQNRPAWVPPTGAVAYRGITVWSDKANSWVGTRTIWNQHAYSVSNVCDSRDGACAAPNVYGSIPKAQKPNWTLSWLNNFRQNVQDQGLFDAPDATVSVTVDCGSPIVVHVSIRNVGIASLPAGVVIGVFIDAPGGPTQIGTVTSSKALLAGQTEVIDFTVPAGAAGQSDTYFARIIVDPLNKTFNECRDDNNESQKVTPFCGPS